MAAVRGSAGARDERRDLPRCGRASDRGAPGARVRRAGPTRDRAGRPDAGGPGGAAVAAADEAAAGECRGDRSGAHRSARGDRGRMDRAWRRRACCAPSARPRPAGYRERIQTLTTSSTPRDCETRRRTRRASPRRRAGSHRDRPPRPLRRRQQAPVPRSSRACRSNNSRIDSRPSPATPPPAGCCSRARRARPATSTAAGEPEKGPFLGGITTRYSRAELLESILRPVREGRAGLRDELVRDDRQPPARRVRRSRDRRPRS